MKRLLSILLTCSFLLLLNVTTWAVGDDINLSLYGDFTVGQTGEEFQITDDAIDSFAKNKGSYGGITIGGKLEVYNLLFGGDLNIGMMSVDELEDNLYDKANVNMKWYCGVNLIEDDQLRIAVTGSYLGMVYGDEYDDNKQKYINTFGVVGLGIGGELTYMLTDNLSLDGYVDVALLTAGSVIDEDADKVIEQEELDPLMMFYGVKLNYFLSDNVALYGGVKAYVLSIPLYAADDVTFLRRVNLGYTGFNMGISLIF